MSLNMLKEAVQMSKYSKHTRQAIKPLQDIVGKDLAYQLVEGIQINPQDYSRWLDVILGYAKDNNIKINSKTMFQDVAYAVLENDPKMIETDLQDAIVGKLWTDYKAHKEHAKVEKVTRAKEEEEQLKYALDRMRRGTEEEEVEEDFDDMLPFDPDYDEYEREQNGFYSHEDQHDDNEYDLDDGLPFEEEEFNFDDEDEDLNFSFDDEFEGAMPNDFADDDDNISSFDFGDEYDDQEFEFNDDIPFEEEEMFNTPVKKFKPKTYYASEGTKTGNSSIFSKGELVRHKKEGTVHEIELADGPNDTIGIKGEGGRLQMVPSKHFELAKPKSEENEESTSIKSRQSLLHDVLTGANTHDHLTKLQKEVETDGANAWVKHHASSPKNPHPKGSIAYKSWQKGWESAAKEIWAPKKVELAPKSKAKAKPKKK